MMRNRRGLSVLIHPIGGNSFKAERIRAIIYNGTQIDRQRMFFLRTTPKTWCGWGARTCWTSGSSPATRTLQSIQSSGWDTAAAQRERRRSENPYQEKERKKKQKTKTKLKHMAVIIDLVGWRSCYFVASYIFSIPHATFFYMLLEVFFY